MSWLLEKGERIDGTAKSCNLKSRSVAQPVPRQKQKCDSSVKLQPAETKLTLMLQEFESSLKQSIDLIQKCLQEHIFDNISASMPSAIEDAPDTAYSWGAPRGEGGLYWSTYKATVRRQGVYSGASGPRDFNQELFDPISRNLATGWERAFQYRLPTLLKSFADEMTVKLQQFHQAAKARAEQHHTNVAGLVTLSSQILAHERTVQALPAAINQKVTELQREANREFTPVICQVMADAYEICANEHGTGSYARMKDAMINHVEIVRGTMFHDATEAVRARLSEMCRSVMEVSTSFFPLLIFWVRRRAKATSGSETVSAFVYVYFYQTAITGYRIPNITILFCLWQSLTSNC